jgi:hypothetical protein
MTKASVIGFGTRTPSCVLQVLAQASKTGLVQSIEPSRSSALELALLSPPYRTFLESRVVTSASSSVVEELVVLCLPTVSDYAVSALQDVNEIRSKLLTSTINSSASSSLLALVYNPAINAFVSDPKDATADDSVNAILSALQSGPSPAVASYNAAALLSMAQLDLKASTQMNPLGDGQHDTVIVVGSGGREHAIAVALALSPLVEKVIVCPGNGGTAMESNPKIVNAPTGYTQQNDSVIQLVKETKAALVAVGPEAPLVDGLVDALAVQCPGVLAFGPSKAAAQLEASKVSRRRRYVL